MQYSNPMLTNFREATDMIKRTLFKMQIVPLTSLAKAQNNN